MKALRELLAAAVLAFTLYTLVTSYPTLPQQIPTHFGADGLANGWGDKSTLWILMAPLAFQYILLSLIPFLPASLINIPVRSEQRAAAIPFAYDLIDWMKVEVTCIFAFIIHATLSVATGQSQGLGLWFLPITLVVIFGTSIYYIVRMRNVSATSAETL